MSQIFDRRTFLNRSLQTAVTLGAGVASSPGFASNTPQEGADRPKKSVMFSMLPENLDLEARYRLAKEVGFEGVEIHPIGEEQEALSHRRASEKAGIRIHSVIYGGWDAPLSDPKPEVAERGIQQVKNALQSAKWLGADDILLVPAIVTPQTRYKEAYARSQKNIRKLIPTAEKLGIMILVEEVWNKFLLSPMEFAKYVDEFHHPLVQAYFDVGNVVIWGYPEDWIRTLGKRIKRVHLKDFRRNNYQFVNLREGDVNWKEVRKAFAEVGFTNYMTTELGGGDVAYLRDVSQRVDIILQGA